MRQPESTGRFNVIEARKIDNSSTVVIESEREIVAADNVAKSVT